jgi:hypothetical protein
MNRTLTAIAAIAFGFISLSATTAHADGPTIDVQATCDAGLTITTSGYPEGQVGFFSIGGEPPRQLALNGVSHTDWPEFMTNRSYLIFTNPGDPAQVYSGDPGCAIELPVAAEPEPAPAPAPVVTAPPVEQIGTALWANVALAPPW